MRQRLIDVMRHWYNSKAHPWQPLILANPSLDLAVAWGAAYYGWLRHSGGRRIGGGSARSYYVGVEGAASAQPSAPASGVSVLCVVPQRLEAVAGADQVDADPSVAHRRPPDSRTDWRESRRSGLSAASTAGRSSSVQSAFFITK